MEERLNVKRKVATRPGETLQPGKENSDEKRAEDEEQKGILDKLREAGSG